MAARTTALVTGASGGIGYELSKLIAADGYDLALVARQAQKLEEIAAAFRKTYGVQVTVLAKDLSQPAAPDEIFAALKDTPVEMVVNNAGFGVRGPLVSNDWAAEQQLLQVNIWALTRLTKLFLPGLLARHNGYILNVGSTGSFQPVPLMALYGASKAYVLSFSEALAEELRGTGVSVTALCPGVTTTGFHARAQTEKTTMVRRSGAMSAEAVAQLGYRALKQRRPVVVTGLFNQLMVTSVRFGPRALVARIARRMME